MRAIKKLFDRLLWRRRLCWRCDGCLSVSNFGPCYTCKQGSNFRDRAETIDLEEIDHAGNHKS